MFNVSECQTEKLESETFVLEDQYISSGEGMCDETISDEELEEQVNQVMASEDEYNEEEEMDTNSQTEEEIDVTER